MTDSPKPPPERVSLTFGALNRARAVWFIVSGEAKAEAVARALAEHPPADPHDVPAAGVTGSVETVLVPRPRVRLEAVNVARQSRSRTRAMVLMPGGEDRRGA